MRLIILVPAAKSGVAAIKKHALKFGCFHVSVTEENIQTALVAAISLNGARGRHARRERWQREVAGE